MEARDGAAADTAGPTAPKRGTADALPGRRRIRLPHPAVIASLLLIVIFANSAVLAWRWTKMQDRPPSTYYEFQIQRWEQQLIDTPEDPLIWATLGGLYESAGDSEKSRQAFSKALELDPNNVAALMNQAEADAEAGEYEEARTRLNRVVEALPKGGKYLAYYRLGETEERAGDDAAAIEAYVASIEDSGQYWNAHYRLALLLENAGDTAGALSAAEQAGRFAQGEADVEALIARLRAKAGEEKGAQ